MKKIIAIILAVLLLCGTSVLAVTGLFSMETAQSGDEITVTVTLNEDISAENATMLQGELYYDPEVLTPVSVTASDAYSFLTCVISRREPRVQWSFVSETSEPLPLPAGTVLTAVFTGNADTELRLEMDLQTADGAVVADLTQYAQIIRDDVPENPFTDVPENSFYYKSVLWAVENGITKGMTPTTFVPNGSLLRAQAVVMLWRAAGAPEPQSTQTPFTDLNLSSYYYKAVLWAVENGITKGVTATTFNPEGVTTRAQVVTFLWRYLGKPGSDTENPFTDVPEASFYYEPVLWAVENGVTKGMSTTQFGVDANCNRAHMVTFLYRALN